MDQQAATTPEEIWSQAFHQVQEALEAPTVWLAMLAARPLALEGNRLIVGMPRDVQYLSVNLQTHEYATVIDDALKTAAGRPLQLHIIDGEKPEDWLAARALEAQSETGPDSNPPSSVWRGETFQEEAAPVEPEPVAAKPYVPPSHSHAAEAGVEKIENWDRLNERLTLGFKRAPLARYPHGQAAFLLHAVKLISATMDHFMDAPFGHADPAQERALAKAVERLGVTVSLDPFFISLELMRYRRDQGRDIGSIPPN